MADRSSWTFLKVNCKRRTVEALCLQDLFHGKLAKATWRLCSVGWSQKGASSALLLPPLGSPTLHHHCLCRGQLATAQVPQTQVEARLLCAMWQCTD